jgi:FMN phosphatase YigB (HAD superfamily)
LKQVTPYKNIIFDFGGVLIDIDYQRCVRAFQQLGFDDFDKLFSQLRQHHIFDRLETGKIGAKEFYNEIREASGLPLTDGVLEEAWNSMLIGMPWQNVEMLKKLVTAKCIFLLSNTNEIHEKAFTKMLEETYGHNLLSGLFERVYFSHRIGMRKPDVEIFEHVIHENKLVAEETLFIDDLPQHIEGATKANLQTHFLEKGQLITDLF